MAFLWGFVGRGEEGSGERIGESAWTRLDMLLLWHGGRRDWVSG